MSSQAAPEPRPREAAVGQSGHRRATSPKPWCGARINLLSGPPSGSRSVPYVSNRSAPAPPSDAGERRQTGGAPADYRLGMPRQTLIPIILSCCVLGCAVASPIRPAATSSSAFWFPGWHKPVTVASEVPEGEQFRISHRGSTGYTPGSAVRRSAHARAGQSCERQGRILTPITEQSSSPGRHGHTATGSPFCLAKPVVHLRA
jgi:hypothetical protein